MLADIDKLTMFPLGLLTLPDWLISQLQCCSECM